jgi:CBS domain containing-hemolysin-like protein
MLWDIGRILLTILLVAANGFFVAAEFAFVRIRPSTVNELAEEGKRGSYILKDDVLPNLDNYLAVTQLGITISSLGLGWAGEPAVASILEPLIGIFLSDSILHIVSFAISFFIITLLHVVYGELAPKTLAIYDEKKVSLFVAYPMKFFYYAFIPGIIIFNGLANYSTGIFGIEPASETEEVLEEEEILRILGDSSRSGKISADEINTVRKVFNLDDINIKDIMIPKVNVDIYKKNQNITDVYKDMINKNHTRYPILDGENGGNVVGFIDIRDVFREVDGGVSEDTTCGDIMDDVLILPETTKANEALFELQSDESQMAAVVNEWGAFEGIVTVEDISERIVGDLRDKFDSQEDDLVKKTNSGYISEGMVPIDRVNKVIGSSFKSDEARTIGGLVLEKTGAPPEEGKSIEINGYDITIESMDGVRIELLRISD